MNEQELLGYLRDAVQGASNSAAATVSGPVDLLAWLLKKGGAPVGDAPVGGSDWMAQKGLTAKPQNALAGMAGETIGNISPIVAAAKAPQIANALLRVGENAAARPMLNPQTGAIVWHGSPHKFDSFDSSKIGTGEGAQAYGHGLYLADTQDVAKTYARSQMDRTRSATLNGMRFRLPSGEVVSGPSLFRAMYAPGQKISGQTSLGVTEEGGALVASLKNKYGEVSQYQFNGQRIVDPLSVKGAVPKTWVAVDADPSIYKVDLPDNAIARMLDWDKPLSQQAPEVRDAMVNAFPSTYVNGRFVDPMRSGKTGRALLEELGAIANKRGDAGLRQAEPSMRAAGIPGIRYLDGGSRGAGQGTSNYVVFPGEENLLRILERNGATIGQ